MLPRVPTRGARCRSELQRALVRVNNEIDAPGWAKSGSRYANPVTGERCYIELSKHIPTGMGAATARVWRSGFTLPMLAQSVGIKPLNEGKKMVIDKRVFKYNSPLFKIIIVPMLIFRLCGWSVSLDADKQQVVFTREKKTSGRINTILNHE